MANDAITYPTLAKLLQQHPGNVNYAQIYESVKYDTPLIDKMPAEVIAGVNKNDLISTSIPLIGAVPYNSGMRPFRSDYKTVNVQCHPYAGMIALDKKFVKPNPELAGQMMEREIRNGLRGIKINLERSLLYGKAISNFGMEGLVDQIGDYMTISATGNNKSRVHKGSSVWILCLQEDMMHMVWGGSKSITFGAQKETPLPMETPDGKMGLMTALTRDVDFHAGFQLLDDCAAVRIVNIDDDNPLTDALIARALEVLPEGRQPNLILTNRHARYLLQQQRAAKYTYIKGTSGSTPDASTPTDYEGLPIAVSSALLKDETEANLKKLKDVTAIKTERDITNLKR